MLSGACGRVGVVSRALCAARLEDPARKRKRRPQEKPPDRRDGGDGSAREMRREGKRARHGEEPSDDARFAALVCAFGLWLRGEGGGMIDEEVMLALAREVASGRMVADRYDFLNLIDEATKLPEK